MEDTKTIQLRKRIQEIHKNSTLSPQEKSRQIQALLRGKEIENSTDNSKSVETTVELDKSITFKDAFNNLLGCKHYLRGAKIRAACCGQLFTCRLCHDDKVTSHHINRFDIKEMMCMHCQTIQSIGQKCINESCGKVLGKYYCYICKFLDDDPNKNIYHCPHCGICRIGKGLEIDFYHCMKCNACISVNLKGSHTCIENNFKSNCPICKDDLFTSRSSPTIMKCGHAIHQKCYQKYIQTNYTCPFCSKSLGDMSSAWASLDDSIQRQTMPIEFKDSKASILCNDCLKKSSDLPYHFLGVKCTKCGSYNTKITSTTGFPSLLVTPSVPLDTAENIAQAYGAQQQQQQQQNNDNNENNNNNTNNSSGLNVPSFWQIVYDEEDDDEESDGLEFEINADENQERDDPSEENGSEELE